MAEQPEDFSKLPLPDRWTHKNWKVRKEGYEDAAKEFAIAEQGEHDPIFRMFDANLMKGAVADSNVAAQQEGLAALCSYMKNGARENATRTKGHTLGPIVEKGLPSTRAGVKQNALEACMLYVEIDKADPVIEEILPLFSHKQPKVTAAVLAALTSIFHEFGVKIVDPKLVLKHIPKVFGHADKNVRAEATNLCVELYRWLKDAMKPLFWNDLKDLQKQELEKLFEAVRAEPSPKQERLTRAQQYAAAAAEARGEEEVAPAAEEAAEEPEEIEVEDLALAVDVLGKVPANFYENMASSKWKDRKDALEAFHQVANVPKIENGQFNEMVNTLAKCMKDANVMVVTFAANCVEDLSNGLRRDFAKYRSTIMSPMLERLKEKKPSVTEAIGRALDGVLVATSLSECLEEILEFLKHKNPLVKLETLRFLIRALQKTRTVPSMPEVKAIAEVGTKMMTESTEVARAGGAETVGTLMKIMGEKPMAPFLDGLDDIRKAKVKEFYDSAQVKAKNKPKAPPAPKAAAPPPKRMVKKAPGLGPKKAAPRPASPQVDDTPIAAPKSVSRPAGSKLSGPPKSGLSAPSGGLKLQKKVAPPSVYASPRRNISPQSVDEEEPPPAPRLGLGRGLAGRPLAKPTPLQPEPSRPQVSDFNAAERAELDALRASKIQALQQTIEDLRAASSKQELELNGLRTHEAELIDERTRDRLTIKAKETQLVRARSDAELAEETVQRQQREIERLKRELTRSVRTSSPPPADVSDQIYRDGNGSAAGFSVAGIDRYESNRVSREVGYQRARSYMTSPSEEKENGSLEASAIGKGSVGGRSPGRSSRGRDASDGSARAESPGVGGGEGSVVDGGKPIESWRRAAEVTSQLKARIEQMKARQGLGRPH